MIGSRQKKELVVHFRDAARKGRLSPDATAAFRKIIYGYYQRHARKFPWRATRNPYHILVSEIMLQQTQTERVIKKYRQFIKAFPDFATLSRTPLHKILIIWQGLGYNRRALALKRIAQRVVKEFAGNLPAGEEILTDFPGIGKATASAIAAFAFNQPSVFVETNIRTVFIHFFFRGRDRIKDSEILPLVRKTLDASSPREWYYALMDYGVMLEKTGEGHSRTSAHYKKQTPFRNSNRQIRGMILRTLLAKPGMSENEILSKLKINRDKTRLILLNLCEEGFVKKEGKHFVIA
jgi:A/G-specific adenine glycosylase